MVPSADMTPAAAHFNQNVKQPSNVSGAHEVYEVQYNWRKQSLKIYRLRNLLFRKHFHIASSKSQMTEQLKPIRMKHGTPNPAKALRLKLSIPQ